MGKSDLKLKPLILTEELRVKNITAYSDALIVDGVAYSKIIGNGYPIYVEIYDLENASISFAQVCEKQQQQPAGGGNIICVWYEPVKK